MVLAAKNRKHKHRLTALSSLQAETVGCVRASDGSDREMRLGNALNAGEFLLRPLRRLQIAKYNDTTAVAGCQGTFQRVKLPSKALFSAARAFCAIPGAAGRHALALVATVPPPLLHFGDLPRTSGNQYDCLTVGTKRVFGVQ